MTWRGYRVVNGLFVALSMSFGAAHAQTQWADVAVPGYNPAQWMQATHRYWTEPRAAAFVEQAQQLTSAWQSYCGAPTTPAALETLRQQWRSTTTAWEKLSAVAIGPLLQRRSLRQIDFTPTRPALIERAIQANAKTNTSEPLSANAMERIGTPAKGLPALEWLLWTRPSQPVQPGTPACRYAIDIARDIEREAQALHSAFQALAQRKAEDWSDEDAVNAVNEFVNQWIGALERLRWTQMEKPLRAGKRDELPRAASHSSAASWAAQWDALQTLARSTAEVAPAPGTGLVPLETYLRGRGLNALANQWLQELQRADQALRAATPNTSASVLAAARQLLQLKQWAETQMAPALGVSVGFSDADGD